MLDYPITADQPEPEIIAQAADVLRRGGVVAYPTDTLYGLAVDPRNGDAVARLYAAKGRGQSISYPADRRVARAGTGSRDTRRTGFAAGACLLAWAADDRAARRSADSRPRCSGVGRPSRCACRRTLSRARWRRPSVSASPRRAPTDPASPPAVTGADVAAAFATGSDVDVLLDAGAVTGGPPSTIVEIGGGRSAARFAPARCAWNRVLESLK